MVGGGLGVLVGGTAVSVGGTTVSIGGTGVALGGTGVLVGWGGGVSLGWGADVFVGCTGEDEDSIMACVEARELGAKTIMCIVSRPDYANVMGKLGIDHAVSPRKVMSETAESLVPFRWMTRSTVGTTICAVVMSSPGRGQ